MAKGRYLRMYFHIGGQERTESNCNIQKKAEEMTFFGLYDKWKTELRESRTESNSKKEVFQPH
ncbi:MAG: hypothetical protein J6T49_07795, partial [Bacteroidales bacterium]|nr:hypothetical protein [Bacteroidales bacterium]